jgi:NDP-sugar pyrophosphorylase family protein
LKEKFEFIPIVDADKRVIDILFWNDVFKKRNTKNIIFKTLNNPVIIMSGGKGTRMTPFTNILPKALLPIDNKTVLEKILDNFNKHNIKQYYLTTNYKHNIIKYFISETAYKKKIKIINEKKPLGTAGSLSLLKDKITKPFFLTNCDILINADYYEIYKFHKENKNVLTIVAATNEIKIEYGVCNLNNDGSLRNIDEKPKINFLSNTGLYLINPSCLTLVPKNKYYNMDTLINNLLSKNKKIGIFPIHTSAWKDTGQWTEFKKIYDE